MLKVFFITNLFNYSLKAILAVPTKVRSVCTFFTLNDYYFAESYSNVKFYHLQKVTRLSRMKFLTQIKLLKGQNWNLKTLVCDSDCKAQDSSL